MNVESENINIFSEYWNGKKPLLNTFWLLWVLGSIGITISVSLFVYLIGLMFSLPTASLALLAFLFLILFNPFYLYCWVSVWRSSNHVKLPIIKFGTKGLVIIHVISTTYGLTFLPEFIGTVT